MIEQELKYELSKTDYEKLLKSLKRKVRKTLVQRNVYFDDSKLSLRTKRFGLRIRYEGNRQAVVTLKFPAKAAGKRIPSLKLRNEFEAPVSVSIANEILKGNLHLSELDILPIRMLKNAIDAPTLIGIEPLGELKTVRRVMEVGQPFYLELDSCELFGKKFFELEVETLNPAKADALIRALFKENQISYRPGNESKLGRFIKEWKRKS